MEPDGFMGSKRRKSESGGNDGYGMSPAHLAPATAPIYATPPTNPTGVTPWTQVQLPPLDHSYKIDTKPLGKFVIVSNEKFKSGHGTRYGTEIDVKSLETRFTGLGFMVETHRNKKAHEIRNLFRDLAKENHSDFAVFGCALLSHGEDGDLIFGTDCSVDIKHLCEYLSAERCPSLAGKPKLFFIQACRGEEFMGSVQTESDGPEDNGAPPFPSIETIPVKADFLIAYSVVPGCKSFRDPDSGTLFIQALCRCLEKYGSSTDLLKMLTRVSYLVTMQKSPSGHSTGQLCCFSSRLLKDLYLDPSAIPSEKKENLSTLV